MMPQDEYPFANIDFDRLQEECLRKKEKEFIPYAKLITMPDEDLTFLQATMKKTALEADRLHAIFESLNFGSKKECRKLIEHNKQVCNKLYACSTTMINGYLSPSPIKDIVVGNCNRKKLKKTIWSRWEEYYIYYFDDSDYLCMVESCPDEHYMLFRNEKDVSYGLNLTKRMKRDALLECKYSDNVIQEFNYYYAIINMEERDEFSVAFVNMINKISYGLRWDYPREYNLGTETYEYCNGKIVSARCSEKNGNSYGFSSKLYSFTYDNDYYGDYYYTWQDEFGKCISAYRCKNTKKRRYDEFIKRPKYSELIK